MLCSSYSQGRPRKRGRGVGPIHCEPRSVTEKETSGSAEPNGTGSRRVAMDTQQNSTLCVIHGLITSFFERVLSCSRTYKRFVIFIFFLMHVWSMIRICWFSLWHDKDYMFLWVTRSIARFKRRLTHKTRQVQHNMSHCGILAGEENKPKAGHVILSLFGSSSKVIPMFFIWEGENKTGTSPVSSTSTLVEHGGVVGKWIMQLSMQVSVSELANTKDSLQRPNSVAVP